MNLQYDIADGVAVETANFGEKLNLPGSDEFCLEPLIVLLLNMLITSYSSVNAITVH